MQYNDSYNELMLSFANNIHTTDGGTHEDGFKRALTRVMNDYARKYNILKDNDKNLSGEDVREGLTVVISVKLKDAQFEGQTKARLGNTEVGTLVSRLGDRQADHVPGGKPGNGAGRSLIKRWPPPARGRPRSKARELVRRKSALETAALPGKLADCQSQQPGRNRNLHR